MRSGLLLLAFVAGTSACGADEPPLAGAGTTARAFIQDFAAGRYSEAGRLAEGDVSHGVAVQQQAREEELRSHPAEIAMLDKAMRDHPPQVKVLPARKYADHVEVRTVVTTQGPRGPERTGYTLSLVWREEGWRVYRWEREPG